MKRKGCGFGASKMAKDQRRGKAEECGQHFHKCNVLFVNAYLSNGAWGGPEEGGWWYDEGKALASVPIEAKPVKSRDGLWDLQPVMPQEAAAINARLKETFACMAGYGRVIVRIEECPAKDYPESRPYFE